MPPTHRKPLRKRARVAARAARVASAADEPPAQDELADRLANLSMENARYPLNGTALAMALADATRLAQSAPSIQLYNRSVNMRRTGKLNEAHSLFLASVIQATSWEYARQLETAEGAAALRATIDANNRALIAANPGPVVCHDPLDEDNEEPIDGALVLMEMKEERDRLKWQNEELKAQVKEQEARIASLEAQVKKE